MTTLELPDFDTLWDYEKPQETEQAFRALLPAARESGNRSYLIQLLTQIARAQALQRRFDEAHQTLDEAQALLSDDLMRARIRCALERGRVFNSSKHPAEARPLFLEAWDLASAHHEDFYAVDAAHMMAIIEPPERQLAWHTTAIEYAQQSPEPRARRWLGSLLNNMGWTYHDAGQYEKALEVFERALAARQEQGSSGDIRVARWCIARTLRSLGRVQEALDMQTQLLGELQAAEDGDGYTHEEIAECLLALGQASAAQAHFARAYAKLSQDPWLVDGEPDRLQRLKELGRL